jgi:ribose transport system substrate-binding protein
MRTRHTMAVAGAMMLTAVLASGSMAQSPAADEPLDIAYLSFAVANSYDAPMLAAAQNAASAANARLQVFDANNSPDAQAQQLQDAVTLGTFDGIIVQPIVGAALVTGVQDAIAQGIKVANLDQVLGADMTTSDAQVDDLAANVVFVPSEIGRKMGVLTKQACEQAAADPCEVGYIYAFKGYPLDNAIKAAFDAEVGDAITIVAEGEGFFSAIGGLTAGQNMLTSQPGIDVIVGSDQAITGALLAAQQAGVTAPLTVGYGGGAIAIQEIAAGTRFGTVMQLPATEGSLATQQLITALRTGENQPGVDPVSELPDEGIVTAENADQFTAEWPG